MLASISPVGEASRGQRWWITVSAYTLGSTLGGVGIGALAGGLGVSLRLAALPDVWTVGGIALVALVGAGIDAGWLPLSLRGWRRQVDERWLTTYRGWAYGVGYGLQLGFAVVTVVTSAVTYAAIVSAFATGRLTQGAAIGLTFGVVRALPLMATGWLRTPHRLRRFHAWMARVARPADRATVVTQLGVAVVAVTTVVRSVT